LGYAKAKGLNPNIRWTASRMQLQFIRKNIQNLERRKNKMRKAHMSSD